MKTVLLLIIPMLFGFLGGVMRDIGRYQDSKIKLGSRKYWWYILLLVSMWMSALFYGYILWKWQEL